VLGEALAAGLPCLANDVGGIRDLVHNGETGFLFPHDASADVWAAHIKSLARNPDELSRMSRSAQRFAEDNLGIDRFERLIGEVIERLERGLCGRLG
jgi:glycosyltransferase involved in cell wall biosynthesis